MMNNTVVIVRNQQTKYPTDFPFHPPEDYPEYVFKGKGYLSRTNGVYPMVRECLHLLGLDRENYGTIEWNPLGELIKPGDKVVLKPNFVRDYHEGGKDIYSIITHPSIIRAMIDYVYIALKGRGEIVIADAPLGDTNFEEILNKTKVSKIKKLYGNDLGFKIPILDLRKTRYKYEKEHFLPCEVKLKGDPSGYVKVNLGKNTQFTQGTSSLFPLPQGERSKVRGIEIPMGKVNRGEGVAFVSPGPKGLGVISNKVNGYLISKTILSTDVIISLPKLKVHKKAGVSLNLKNMLGISGDKNWLPHFRVGSTSEGGDEVSDDDLKNKKRFRQYLKRKLFKLLLDGNYAHKGLHYRQKQICSVGACPRNSFASVGRHLSRTFIKVRDARKFPRSFSLENILKEEIDEQLPTGDWYGNDTIWRTILDLNKIVIYADKNGSIQSRPQRKFFSLIDGVIAGEKEGPLNPTPKKCGVIISGLDFVSVDLAAIKVMGFDYKKTPQYRWNKKLSKIKVISENIPSLSFVPPKGWKGHIEKSR